LKSQTLKLVKTQNINIIQNNASGVTLYKTVINYFIEMLYKVHSSVVLMAFLFIECRMVVMYCLSSFSKIKKDGL